MKNIFILLLFSSFLLVSCSESSSDSDDPCSSASNKDDEECSKIIDQDTNVGNLQLQVEFEDSYFYNSLERKFKTVSKDNLDGGLFGVLVPIYSSFLNKTPTEAVDLVIPARDQQNTPESFNTSDLNIIPYIEIKNQEGVDFVYQYVKKDLEGNPVASITGDLIKKNNRVFLPLVNGMFGNQFYSPTDPIGQRFIHQIAISAKSSNQQGSIPKIVEFESSLQTPVTDFFVDYLNDVKNFTLDNRFEYYFNGSDNVPNQNFGFFSLKELDEPEAVPVDLRVLFKERPVLKIEQELFFEVPFNVDKFKTTGEPELIRGQSFFVKETVLDSLDDFRMKVILNNQIQNLTDGREFIVNNLPAGTPWNIEFFYNFQQNDNYSSPSSLPLITPYKPTCNEISNQSFSPLQAAQEKRQALQSNGFLSLCHPELNRLKFFSETELATTTLEESDTFYNFFNYIPLDEGSNISGHFNGIRSVTFKLEGCVRIYVKTPTSTDWELKSASNNACFDEGDSSGEGWVYFNAERKFTINDYVNNYDSVRNLKELIQSFSTKPIRTTPHFKFNGLVNDTEHLY